MPVIEVQGAKVSYAVNGPANGPANSGGETVLALHSSACSGGQWRGLAETICAQVRLVTPDLIGYGGSDPWQGAGRLRLADEAARVEAVLDALEGPVHLVGHSYGGAVALKLAREQSRRFASLTLIEPVAFHLLSIDDPLIARSFAEVRRLADEVTARVGAAEPEAAMRSFVDYWNGAGAWQALGDKQRAGLLRVAPKVPLDFWAAITEPLALKHYAEVTLPTLLIAGGASPQPTRRIFELLATSIPASRGLILGGAGHMAPLTHGDAVNRAIARHVASHGRREARLPMAA